jgi:hypothetical protein
MNKPLKNKPIEVMWRVLSLVDQERLAADFEDCAKRRFSSKEAIHEIIKMGLHGPGNPLFCPTLNRRVHAAMVWRDMTNSMRGVLHRKVKKALARNDDFEANYYRLLLDNFVTARPNKEWINHPP